MSVRLAPRSNAADLASMGPARGLLRPAWPTVRMCPPGQGPTRGYPGPRRNTAPRAAGAEAEPSQVLVCTNKVCRKSGSLQVLEYFRCLAPPNVDVASTGCLGKCGAGPNIVVMPEELFIGHCNTAAHVARLLEKQCGAHDAETNLKAFELMARGSEAYSKGKVAEAEALFSEAIDLKPSGGLPNLYCSRAACRTSLGHLSLALEDIEEARKLKPGWTTALLREAQVYEAAKDPAKALAVYSSVADQDSEFRRSKLYLRKRKELEPLLCNAAVASG